MQKSTERLRAQRSTRSAADGSEARSPFPSACEREPALERKRIEGKGGRFFEGRRSSSYERRNEKNASRITLGLRAGAGSCVATVGERDSRSRTRMPFTRHRGNGLGVLRSSTLERATRVSEAQGNDCGRGKTTPPTASPRAWKREARREAQFSPASFASIGPEPFDAGFSRLPWGQLGGGERTRANRRSRERARSREASERGRPVNPVAALGRRASTGARVETVSECRSRSNASPAATPRHAIPRLA